eukprot:CAMPEP_0119101184 /NCGR_PEP_ID=MMETSP1180-20130426/300_1 /TAXON_ID=3052 ORGANISM="Chlamydomonas cf sp, Strain CCMP681" /NCGR_SAMPLE_ID=MMETSP1180 /ASSEMBLY_ACC=CAM_ASM_000741 /LENGTH=410 /DNA_ID=CAMNT_0007085265 /DNA_START=76 /DNA_END=1308 /DNA_ORIENTATION=+
MQASMTRLPATRVGSTRIAQPISVQRRTALRVSASATLTSPSASASKTEAGRIFNFSAGPAMLPLEVLHEAQQDIVNYKGTGMSIMEMSHRGKEYMAVQAKAEADLRTLLAIPDNYKVLFLQGGASTQFSAIPLNLTTGPDDVTDYIITGAWSKKAQEEGKKYTKANVVTKGDNKSIPAASTWKLSPEAKFVHYCDNETIGGVEFKGVPNVGDKILVADMSSNFMSKPVDVAKYGIIYAGAQKNVGPSGVVIVIIRDDLIGHARAETPTMLDFKTHSENDSMYNTPPCWSIYVCGMVFEHLLKKGGLAAVRANNEVKAKLLYDTIAESKGFYNNPVAPESRSLMNVPFTIPSNPDLEKAFIKEAEKLTMVQLKGHRSVGGMRASIYNAMPLEGVQLLAKFMREFAAKHQA